MDNSNIQTFTSSKDSICWNCKRCTGNLEYPCPWAQDGTPVNGWIAKRGKVFEIPYAAADKKEQKKKCKKEWAYLVIECPLYIKDHEFGTMREIYEAVAKANNIDIKSVYKYKYLKFKKYEEITGTKLPIWAWNNK